jgi:hypothetical protein
MPEKMAARLDTEFVEYQNTPRSGEFGYLEALELEQTDFHVLPKE